LKSFMKVHGIFKNNSENNVNSMKSVYLHNLIKVLNSEGWGILLIISVPNKDMQRIVFNVSLSAFLGEIRRRECYNRQDLAIEKQKRFLGLQTEF
jgi:hypothetical protein